MHFAALTRREIICRNYEFCKLDNHNLSLSNKTRFHMYQILTTDSTVTFRNATAIGLEFNFLLCSALEVIDM